MLMVANTVYLCSLDKGLGPKRTYNNYFTALFHDLPEVLTKDIISPVKRSVSGLEDLLESYEKELVEAKLLPLLPSQWHRDFKYLLFNPFDDRISQKGVAVPVPGGLGKDCSDDDQPVDGAMIKSCDQFAAFMEAQTSIRYGVRSKTLEEGMEELRGTLSQRMSHGVDFKGLIERFDEMRI